MFKMKKQNIMLSKQQEFGETSFLAIPETMTEWPLFDNRHKEVKEIKMFRHLTQVNPETREQMSSCRIFPARYNLVTWMRVVQKQHEIYMSFLSGENYSKINATHIK